MLIAALALLLQVDWEKHPENQWVLQSPRPNAPAPKLGWEGSGAYDPVHRVWIHHAGHDGIPQGFVLFTCSLETGTWSQKFPPNSPPGVCCVDGANVFDAAAGRFVRFPGGSLGHGYQWSRGVRMKESAVWLYDPGANRWTNMRPAPYGEGERRDSIGGLCPGSTYAEGLGLSLSFGGTGSSGAKNNLHAYDAWSNTLYLRKGSKAPEVRDGMGLAYDPVHERLVMFGSQYLSDEKTWTYSFRTNAWESHDLEPHPPGKKGGTYSTIPKMAYDSANGAMLCVAWLGEKDGHETWILDPEKLKWTKVEIAGPDPSKSRSRNLVYSRELNLFILETTAVKGGPEVWTYRYRKAAPAATPVADLVVVTEAGKASLSWKSVGPSEVDVFRAEPADPWALEFKKVGASKGGTFEDAGLASGKAYVYQVGSLRARTQPRVPDAPVVSVLAADRVDVRWSASAAKDVTGYNLYRGVATVKTVSKGTAAPWKDNDPEYAEPQVVRIADVTRLEKVNDKPLAATSFEDRLDLAKKGVEAGDYKWAVHAYVVRSVNRLGTESGPSPYALTLPAEPTNVLCHEKGTTAELKWDPAAEKGVQGYHVYKLEGGVFGIKRVTEKPVAGTTFSWEAGKGSTRFWVVTVDALGQEGQPSSPAWFGQTYKGFYEGDWHP